MRHLAVSFDLGQTLVEFDETLLQEQALRCGYWLNQSLVRTEQALAWKAYDAAKANGKVGYEAWSAFIRDILARVEFSSLEKRGAIDAARIEAFVRFLWTEQPHKNLWRRPVPGMLDLVQRLFARKTRVGVLTNSEGRAKELIQESAFGPFVDAIVDSGVEGIEKPDPRVFARMAERLGCSAAAVIHVGDSFEADVLGALGAGMTPILFSREPTVTLPPGVLWCRDAGELGKLLAIE
jgi:HAD superfamily hydrolase (TIGR01509 family)